MPQENYIYGDVIGKGSYGEVTLARHKRDKRQYVIKKIDFHNASPKERLYAQQEVDILSKLKHPNIVSYKESFQTEDGAICIVMGYCELGDLYCHLKKQSKLGEYLSETKLVEWFVQISMALQYMHDRHILHRDLKTQNIFLTKSRIIKIGDLGIARVLENNCDMATTMIGTPYYMSPELFSNKPYNHKSDVWALGCCLYEMATLKHAFNARDMNSLVYKILKGKTPDMPSNYSTELRGIIKSMLNYDPELRPSAASILRLPYIKKQIAIFLEGTKNRRLIREEKKPSKENNVSSDSGFSEVSNEVSNEDPQLIVTASEVQIDIQIDKVSSEVAKEKVNSRNSQCNRNNNNKNKNNQDDKEIKNNLPKDNKEIKNNLSKEKRQGDPIRCVNVNVASCDDSSGNLDNVKYHRKENSRPSDVRKILSDRIQAKARQKRRENEEKRVSKENKSLPADVNKFANECSSEASCLKKEKVRSELLDKPVEKPRRELPVLPSHDAAKGCALPPFRYNSSNVNKESKMKQVARDEERPSVSIGVPNLSARKKRRLRQQKSDSSINTSPKHSDIKGNANSFVSYQSYIPRPKEEIIREHLSRGSANVCERDVVDGPPETNTTASPEETSSGGEDPTSSSGGSEKCGYDVSSLIDTLQATLTMAAKSKEHTTPEAGEFFYDDNSETLTPSSPSAAGRLRHRIELLRKECVDGVGEQLLKEAYEIMNKQSEDDVEKSLINLLGKRKFEEFGGPIWQLKFCEEF